MFDLASAVVLGLVGMGLVSLSKTLLDGPNKARIVVGICFGISLVTVFLVAASDFAKDQVVLKHSLNSLNVASQLVIVLLLTGLMSAAWEIGVKALSNIGENQPPKGGQVPPPQLGG